MNNLMEVGSFIFCPHCGRDIIEPNNLDELEDYICSCCNRPWIACPCTPIIDGDCKNIIEEKNGNTQ